jgi:hypothetical protein
MLVFWVITKSELVGEVAPSSGLNFGPENGRQYVCPKHQYLYTSPHNLTTQKTNDNIFTAIITSISNSELFRNVDSRHLVPTPSDAMVCLHKALESKARYLGGGGETVRWINPFVVAAR